MAVVMTASVNTGWAQVDSPVDQQSSQSNVPQRHSSGLLEEIVVTAQKRDQSLQSVGIAVTAISGEQMREYVVEKSYDIAAMTPGVHISGNLAGQNTQFTIRGVTQNDFNDIVESPNAAYLDEGYIAISQAQTFAVFDIDRVEILKGPQGTLFGRNATGGLVHYISNQPTFDSVEGYVDAEYGFFDSPAHANGGRIEAALGGPLGEHLAARGAVMFSKHGGYLKNLYPDGAVGGSPGPGAGANLGDDDTLAGRFTAVYQPTDRFYWRLSANVERSRLSTGPFQSKPTIAVFEEVNGANELVNVIDVAPGETRATIGPGGVDLGTDLDNNGLFGADDAPGAEFFGRFAPGGDFFGYRDPDGKGFSFSGDFAFKNANSTDTWGVNSNIQWDINDSITLTSISDYKDYEKLLFIDVDSAPVNQSANFAGIDATSFTQEVRLNGTTDKTDWVLGAYYLNIDNHSDNGLKFPVNSVVPGAPFDLSSLADLKTNSYSAFAHMDYQLTEKFAFILGGRIIQEEKDYEFQQAIFFTQDSRQINVGTPVPIGPVFGANGPEAFADKSSDTLWAGNIRGEYTPNDNLLVHAAINRGVKAGSFNAQLAGGIPVPTSAIPYKEEVLWSYETGFKARLFNNMARLNANVFYYDYKDYQAFLFTGVSGVVINADAEYYGADVEFVASPFEGFDFRLAGSWLDATVKDVPLRVNGPISVNVSPNYAPEFQFSGMARYEWRAFGGMLSVMGDLSWSDSYFYNLRNFDADKFDSFFFANARLAWASNDGHWEAALKVNNLTNAKAGIQGFDVATLCGCNEISFRPPRWIGFSLRYAL